VGEPIGETLRKARGARGLTLAKVSEDTKIRARYLQALEAEDWDAMPAPAYARGFLRTYASYLGLDADALVEELRRGEPAAAPEPRPVERQRAPRPAPLAPGPVPWRLVGGLAVVVLLIVVFVLGITGGSGGGGKSTPTAGGQQHRHKHAHRKKPKPPPQPTEASVQLKTTADLWVCLIDQSGKPLVNWEILPAGTARGPFKASSFELSLGNGSVELQVNGKPFSVPDSPNPLGYKISPTSVSNLSSGSRPTCA
jgi:cytoskeleton protein RodZ